jgi:hypothetical protein
LSLELHERRLLVSWSVQVPTLRGWVVEGLRGREAGSERAARAVRLEGRSVHVGTWVERGSSSGHGHGHLHLRSGHLAHLVVATPVVLRRHLAHGRIVLLLGSVGALVVLVVVLGTALVVVHVLVSLHHVALCVVVFHVVVSGLEILVVRPTLGHASRVLLRGLPWLAST